MNDDEEEEEGKWAKQINVQSKLFGQKWYKCAIMVIKTMLQISMVCHSFNWENTSHGCSVSTVCTKVYAIKYTVYVGWCDSYFTDIFISICYCFIFT